MKPKTSLADQGLTADSCPPTPSQAVGRRQISVFRAAQLTMLQLVALIVAGCLMSPLSRADVQALPIERIDSFLGALIGDWAGTAVTTPVGSLPYDLEFRRQPDGSVEGAANPGAAIHTWAFYRQGAHLRLRFRSTFRGNRDPILLLAEGEAGGAIVFQADRPAFLKVAVKLGEADATLRVLHYDRLHVEIHLARR